MNMVEAFEGSDLIVCFAVVSLDHVGSVVSTNIKDKSLTKNNYMKSEELHI